MSNTTHDVENQPMNQSQTDTETQSAQPTEKVSFLQTMGSVIAASFGVQSKKNKERDFQNGSFSRFVVGALLFTVAFVGILLLVVNLVLN